MKNGILLLSFTLLSGCAQMNEGMTSVTKSLNSMHDTLSLKKNVESKDASATLSSNASAKKDKEYVVMTADMPWLTNPPYLKDKDSLEFEINDDRLKEQFRSQAKKDCKLLDLKCREKLLFKTLDKNPIKKRGTLDYVTENYLPIKGSKNQGLKLKKLLEELDSVRKLTRSVSDSMQEKGELTYKEISSEICLIEKVIGYFPKNRYCHGY